MKSVFRYVKLTNQTYKPTAFKTNFQTVKQHTRGKYLIHGTKRCKYNHLQSLELPGWISELRISIWHKEVR